MVEQGAELTPAHDARCEREYTENGFIFIDCLCSLRRAKAEAWDEGISFAGLRSLSGHNPYRTATSPEPERDRRRLR